MNDSVFVVTELVYHDRKVLGVAASLEGAKNIVLKATMMDRKANTFRWVDTFAGEPHYGFSENQGHMFALINGQETDYRVQWRTVEP